MNYKAHYDRLIETRRELNRERGEQYYESHHIVPRSEGGTDDESNLILLTAKEHYVAHLLMWRAEPDIVSRLRAVFFMSNRWEYKSGRVYEEIRNAFAIQRALEGGFDRPSEVQAEMHIQEVGRLFRYNRWGQILNIYQHIDEVAPKSNTHLRSNIRSSTRTGSYSRMTKGFWKYEYIPWRSYSKKYWRGGPITTPPNPNPPTYLKRTTTEDPECPPECAYIPLSSRRAISTNNVKKKAPKSSEQLKRERMAKYKERYHKEYKERYHNDPEFRDKIRARSKARREKLKKENPKKYREMRDRRNKQAAEYRERKRRERAANPIQRS